MKSYKQKTVLIVLIIISSIIESIEVKNNKSTTSESNGENTDVHLDGDPDYPSESYYYDNYEAAANNNDLDTDSETKKKIIDENIVKNLEKSLNDLNYKLPIPTSSNNNTDFSVPNESASNNDDNNDEISSSENENDADDTSDVLIINAEQQDSDDYQLETNNIDSNNLKLLITTTTSLTTSSNNDQLQYNNNDKINNEINIIHKVPVDPNEDLKTTIIDINNISNEGSLASTRQKNYLTFVFVSISIGLVLTGIAVVVVLFVKRRSLLLKSKCQLVSKTKGQQNYTTVGQSDY
jgi:hypothetical protein